MKNVFIIGSGGREHAMAWKMAQSPHVAKVYVAPGNAGTALENKVENVDIAATDINGLLAFAKEKSIAFTLVGPEAPLVAGIVDTFENAGLRCLGPNQMAAQLEGSKQFAKDFMIRHNIPTADYRVFTDSIKAKKHLEQCAYPVVIKADGLAGGKGVVIAENQVHAHCVLEKFMEEKTLGDAGVRVVIEEFLVGDELSFIVMVDGEHIVEFASSQDHKARDDNDQGPNTGGMGAYSPSVIITPALHQEIMETIIKPTITGLREEGILYRGFLYAGLMISEQEKPYVLEYNCRLGDPEAQVLLYRLESDFYELCIEALNGRLDEYQMEFTSKPAVGVVLAAKGYPDQYPCGEKIIFHTEAESEGKIFHAGTKMENNEVLSAGGRVLCAVASGQSIAQAQTQAYVLADSVEWSSKYYRRDIANKALR